MTEQQPRSVSRFVGLRHASPVQRSGSLCRTVIPRRQFAYKADDGGQQFAMPILTTAITTFLFLVLIGIIVGLFSIGARGAGSDAGLLKPLALAMSPTDRSGLPHRRYPRVAAQLAALHRGHRGRSANPEYWRRSSAFRPKAASGIGRHPLRSCRLLAAGRSVGSLLPSLRFSGAYRPGGSGGVCR